MFETSAGSGTQASVQIGRVELMQVAKWELVYYPSSNPDIPAQPVLYLWGRVKRYWVWNRPERLTVLIIPTRPPYRVGQPRPKTPPPFRYIGTVQSLDRKQITLNHGELIYD